MNEERLKRHRPLRGWPTHSAGEAVPAEDDSGRTTSGVVLGDDEEMGLLDGNGSSWGSNVQGQPQSTNRLAVSMRKPAIHILFGLIALTIGFFCWKISDTQMPSYFIAAWLHERHIHAGGHITPHFIFVRWKACQKRIEPSIYSVDGQRYTISGVERQSLPLGLDNFILEPEPVDPSISSGPAVYVARFIWKCGPLDWLFPIVYDVRIPFYIEQ